MTTNKVMKIHEFEDAVYYRASCDCGASHCDLTIELERDKEVDMIFMNMYKDVHWCSYWQADGFFKETWVKIKAALRILFNGHIKVEESFIFKGDDHIDAFLNAIKEGRDYLKNNPE